MLSRLMLNATLAATAMGLIIYGSLIAWKRITEVEEQRTRFAVDCATKDGQIVYVGESTVCTGPDGLWLVYN